MKNVNCHRVLVFVPAAILWCSLTSAENAKKPTDLVAEIRNLQKERIETLQQMVELCMNRWKEGAMAFESVLEAQLELLDAELKGAETLTERIEFVSKQLTVAKEAVKLADLRVHSHMTTPVESLQAKSVEIRIQIGLLKLQLEQQKQSVPKH